MTMPPHIKSRFSEGPQAPGAAKASSFTRSRLAMAIAASAVATAGLTSVGSVVSPAGASTRVPIPAAFHALARCESGGDYATDTGNGYYGAYQFDVPTWQSLGLGGVPSQAAPAVQDRAALSLWKRSGWAPWPSCTAQLGLGSYALAAQGVSTTSPAPGAGTEASYTVQAGDTLSAIANRLGTTTSALDTLNHLADPNRIQVGQVLQV